MQYLAWFLAAFALTGTILNIKKRREGFLIWMSSNFCWCAYDYAIESYAQSALFAIYTVLAVWGWISWKDDADNIA